MSYDVEVWLTERPDLPSILPDWLQGQDGCTIEGKRFLLRCEGPLVTEASDAPPEVQGRLASIGWLIRLHLEGEGTEPARRRLLQAAKTIGKAAHGIAYDPQTNICYTPRSVRRFVLESTRGQYFDALQLTWFHVTSSGSQLADRNRKLIDVLQTWLPEALPRRYGDCEPPQFRFAEGGTSALVAFLESGSITVVWEPHVPVSNVSIRANSVSGWAQRGSEFVYQSNHFSIAIPLAVAMQPGWSDLIDRLLLEVAEALDAFFGDARVLRNQHRGPLTMDGWEKVERHPSGVWRGVPESLGCRVILGEPYLTLWPAFAASSAISKRGKGIVAAEFPHGDARTIVGASPDAIRAPEKGYPPVFPFPRVRIAAQQRLGSLPEGALSCAADS